MQNPKLINAIVTNPFDISKLVKKYIHEHQSTEQTPFNFSTQRKNKTIHNSSYNNNYSQFDGNGQYNNGYFHGGGRKKTVLSDWRMLYQQKKQRNKDKSRKDSRKEGDNLQDNQEIENSQNKINKLHQIPKYYASDKKFNAQQPKANRNCYFNRTGYKSQSNGAGEYSLNSNTTPYKLINKQQYNTPKSHNPGTQPFARSAFKFNLKHGAKNPNRTTSSFRQTNLQSAIVQNLYQQQYIKQRKIQTAKIKRHYQRDHQQRPLSINRQQFLQSNVRQFTSDKYDKNCKEQIFQKLNFDLEKIDLINTKIKQYTITNPNNINNSPSNKNKNKTIKNSKILKEFKFPEKYEKAKIKGTSIRRYKDIVIEGIKQKQDFTNIQGLRFYGTNA